jgi:HAD superfamily hydrolase (TIGR01459 family)
MMVLPLEGLSEIADRYDAYIFDVWGTLYDGGAAFPDAIEVLRQLRQHASKVVILSNSPRLPGVVAARLDRLGIPSAAYDAVVTSGGETHRVLRETVPDAQIGHLGLSVFETGPNRFPDILPGTQYQPVDRVELADWVLNSGPDGEDDCLEDYEIGLRSAASRQLPMICSNPDRIVYDQGVERICAGLLAERYERLGGRVQYFGKPYGAVLERCLENFGENIDRSRVLVVGDNLATDIDGAIKAGLDSLWLTTGVHAGALGSLATSASIDSLAKWTQEGGWALPTLAMPALFWRSAAGER